jgi:hypothetical protein
MGWDFSDYYFLNENMEYLFSGIISGIFVVLYKLLFIDYFNENYVNSF